MTQEKTRRQHRFWTTRELDELRRLYPTMSAKQIAGRLDRCIGSIYHKVIELELRKETGGAAARRKQQEDADRRRIEAEAAQRRAQSPELAVFRAKTLRQAVQVLIEHGVDERAAELAVDLISRGRVPQIKVAW